MACCGNQAPAQAKPATNQTLPYKHLFKYIIVGDTGRPSSPLILYLASSASSDNMNINEILYCYYCKFTANLTYNACPHNSGWQILLVAAVHRQALPARS